MSNNPYESPSPFSHAAVPTGPPLRPTAATVFGILNLLVGGVGLCGTGFSSLMFFVPLDPAMVQQNPALRLMQDNAAYRGFMMISIVLGLLAAIVLMIAGVGLLTGKPFGRQLSIGYAWYQIIFSIIGLIFNIVVVFPAIMPANPGAAGPEQAAAIGGIVGGVCGGLFALIYPAVLLYFMYRPNIIAAYARS